jgi:hypothetical protein
MEGRCRACRGTDAAEGYRRLKGCNGCQRLCPRPLPRERLRGPGRELRKPQRFRGCRITHRPASRWAPTRHRGDCSPGCKRCRRASRGLLLCSNTVPLANYTWLHHGAICQPLGTAALVPFVTSFSQTCWGGACSILSCRSSLLNHAALAGLVTVGSAPTPFLRRSRWSGTVGNPRPAACPLCCAFWSVDILCLLVCP